MQSASGAHAVVTFRATRPARERNLRVVIDWMSHMNGLETLVVEQADRPSLDPRSLPASCRVLFARNPGPFNKSWGFNVGFRATTATVLVFADADILLNRDHLAQSLAVCAEGFDVVRPWSDIVDLTEEETADLAEGRLDLSQIEVGARRGAGRPGEHPPLCGGAYVIRREVYERLGGQDERFFGWGGEDDAMSIKVATLCRQVARVRGGVAFHLNHPRHAVLPVDDGDYRANVALLQEYGASSREALMQLCHKQRETAGDAGRFDR